MAKNRSIEQKRIKYLKQRKARPRYLKPDNGYMKVSQSAGASAITKIPKEARSLFAYRERVKIDNNHNVEAFVNVVLESLFPNNNPPMVKERESEHMRLKVNALEPVERKLLVHNGKFTKMAMVSDRDMTCIYFLEYQIIPGIVRRSITYGSYDRAMAVFQLQTVRWKEVLNIPNVEHAPLD